MQEINNICRAFLWSGDYFSHRPGNVSWEHVCTPKGEGGLGLRRITLWNVAALGRYVWAIEAKKDSLWLRWINAVYIKGAEWWSYVPTQDSSWYWKRICEVKEQMKMIYTAQQLTNMQKFSIQECYKKLTGENEKVNWSKFVWNRLTLPKHRFICWLVMKERLNIALRLRNMGIIDDPLCRLCGTEDETHLHIFFNCPFSLEVCKSISKWMQFELFGDSIDSSCRKVLTSRRSRFQKQSLLAVLGAAIYFIWLARNDAVWNSKIDIIRYHVHRIQKVCIDRIYSVIPYKITNRDKSWLRDRANSMMICN
ncbi:uncharacterized protein LOC104897301 [Beta vulgaris subsp. vulgaris]|uniref:uncharacterized protein LOC104897301 n=1 Tax=Beta vulgaris subsp. vulgaris TaxID=3555 RepID=UPI00053F5D51|nr:uncharacterized protein LOC104897301 [Beta vulgaris subsp. vulgaris]